MSIAEQLEMLIEALKNTDDWEQDHIDADGILCRALKLLAQDTEHQETIERLIQKYNDLSMWYA